MLTWSGSALQRVQLALLLRRLAGHVAYRPHHLHNLTKVGPRCSTPSNRRSIPLARRQGIFPAGCQQAVIATLKCHWTVLAYLLLWGYIMRLIMAGSYSGVEEFGRPGTRPAVVAAAGIASRLRVFARTATTERPWAAAMVAGAGAGLGLCLVLPPVLTCPCNTAKASKNLPLGAEKVLVR